MIKALAALHIKLWLEMAQENLCTFTYMTQLEILQFHMNISSIVGTFNAHCKIYMCSPITQFNHISMTRSKHLFQNIFQNAKKKLLEHQFIKTAYRSFSTCKSHRGHKQNPVLMTWTRAPWEQPVPCVSKHIRVETR